MIAEITPKNKRGISFVVVTAFFTVGELIGILVGYLLEVDKADSNHWRILLIWVSVPSLISFLLGLKYLEESPRYKLLHSASRGMSILNKMYLINNDAELDLNQKEYRKVQKYVANQKETTTGSPLKEVFALKNLCMTLNLWFAWFTLSFVFYGITYILPFVSSSSDDGPKGIDYLSLLYSALGEIPAYVLTIVLIERKGCGRKLSLAVCFFFGGVCCLCTHFFADKAFGPLIFMDKLFVAAAFEFIYPLTAELYNTSCRTVGLGLAGGVSRLGGVVMPWITMWGLNIAPTGPFLIFGGLCLTATFAILMLPHDTAGRELDKIEKQKEKE